MHRALLCCLALVASRTAASPAPAPVPTKAERAPAPTSATPAPKVELSPAPALPALPKGLPELSSPAENPTTPEKAELGWKLFFDKRLSKDGSAACAQCHHVDKAFTSGAALDAKVGGAMNKRNAPQMYNLGYHTTFYWDGRVPTLEAVSLAAWKGQLGADPATVAKTLNAVPVYKALFDRAFGTTGGATAENVPQALAAFFRALTSGNSPWDRFMAGDKAALSKDAQRGWLVFQQAQCAACHAPPLFSDNDFHFLGLPGDDAGRKDATKADADQGRFKTPSLRNVALTAPYFHDGHAKTLSEAVAFMAAGGAKAAATGASGTASTPVDPKLKPFKLSKKDAAALEAFLTSLTGEGTYPKEPALP